MTQVEVKEYETEDGQSPFGKWFETVDAQVAAKVTKAMLKLAAAHRGNTKGVGEGVFE